MSHEQFALPDWTDRLSHCLQELVDYERQLERDVSFMRGQIEGSLGIWDYSHHDREDRIRDRVSRYWTFHPAEASTGSEYQRIVSACLDRLQDILFHHPVLKDARYHDDDGQKALGLNLAVSRIPRHRLSFMLRGLVDHAVKHTPQATAETLAQLIQRGEDRDLSSYSLLLFRGLHVERRHDFQGGLSIVPFDEARRFLPDNQIRLLLRTGDIEINSEPVGAVIFDVKWGPLVVPAECDINRMEWPKKSDTFRDDALLLLDVLSVAHRQPVTSTGLYTEVVEHEIGYLMGAGSPSDRSISRILGENTTRIGPTTAPAILEENLPECERLLLGCQYHVQRRLALSRLASSLSRFSTQGAFDQLIDVAIALEIMYEIDVLRGKDDQLSRRARKFLGQDREDLNWIRRTAKSIYSARNSVLHQGKLPKRADDIYADAFEMGRRTLFRAIAASVPGRGESEPN